MKLSITGRHTEIDNKLRAYLRKRFEKWSPFLPPETEVRVILTVEGYRHQVEVVASYKHATVTGRQVSKDMYSAVDLLAEKVGRQLVRQHEKQLAGQAGGGGRSRALRSAERGRGEPPEAGRIVAVEPVGGKPMTREEAALELQALRQPFLVFEEADSGQVAVLVRRKDGNFTLIVKD